MRGVGDLAEGMLDWFEKASWWKKMLTVLPVVVLTVLAVALVGLYTYSGAGAVTEKVKRSKRRRDSRLEVLDGRERELDKKIEETQKRQAAMAKKLDKSSDDLEGTLTGIERAQNHQELVAEMRKLKGGS